MTITGTAAGVPFLAVPPAVPSPTAPVVVGWHLMDPPRTESAFAAALPLDGLDAWRIYLGLPMCGSRLPAGGPEELMRLGYEDAVLNMFGPITFQAAAEFAPALAELRAQLGIDPGPVGVFGGSLGSSVAQLVLAESDVEISAAVLVSPVVRLRDVIGANERRFDVTYPWSEASSDVARRLDFVARAAELGPAAVQFVVGSDDDPEFLKPAHELCGILGGRSEVVIVAGMGHALAAEPGVEPAPQIPAAAEVDRHAVRWFHAHLPRVDTLGSSARL